MSIFRTFCVLGLIMVFGSIAFGQTVTSTYDKDYGLSKLKTYQFKVEERDKSDPLATDTIMEKKTEDALDDELQSNGYHPPSDGTLPDFLISFHVKTKDKTGERGREWSYVQGTLIVDFYDTETKKLIWRGIASDVVGREEVDLKLAEELVKKAAKLLLEQFNKDLFAY